MRYRARMIGASLELKSQPGSGTQITCALYTAA
jgi:signal transduction histidine kinase